jgi:uncharacterized RDD family membrane protein YckC
VTLNLRHKRNPLPPTFKGHYAGFITRLIAFVIDILIVSVSIGVMLSTFSLILNFFNIELEGISNLSVVIRNLAIFVTGFGFTFFVNFIYVTFFWIVVGKTIGKAVMGLRVIGPRGSRMTIGRSFRRYLGYWISAFPLFLGYFWVLVNDERRAWHDIIAGTSVIYDHEAQYTEGGLGRLAQYAPRLEAKMKKEQLPSGMSEAVPGVEYIDQPEENKE